MEFEVTNLTNIELARTNTVYVNPSSLKLLKATNSLVTIDNYAIFHIESNAEVGYNKIALSKAQREFLNKTTSSKCELKVCLEAVPISLIRLSIDVLKNELVNLENEKFVAELKKVYLNFPFNFQQSFYLFFDETTFKIKVEVLVTKKDTENGVLTEETQVSIVSGSKNVCVTSENGNMLRDFNYESLGIGGLHKEFSTLFRRAFVQRVFSTEMIASLGIMHIKGIMLYGPPGTGKTLIARQIGTLLDARPPKIVNGPEILNKYVGQSEENIRNLFLDAEEEYRSKRQNSGLHIIIFDEIDAICKSRGSSNTGVGDQIVNQLLSKMDGVESLNNILVVGITNRLDLIDEALLRPGRFEIHLEIGLPDEKSRLEILRIHTKKMSKGHFLEGVDLNEVSKLARNYTGAELTAVVKSAVSFALERNVEKEAEKIKVVDQKNVKVTMDDFMNALDEVKPAFGQNEDEFGRYSKIFYETTDFKTAIQTGVDLTAKLLKTNLYNNSSLLLYGKPGTGKTTLAARMALLSKFPFAKLLNSRELVGMNEFQKIIKIKEKFSDSYKSTESVIVLDDLESFIEYVDIGPRFSNSILQALRTLIKTEDRNKLFIIGTTSRIDIMRDTGIFDDFYAHFEVPEIDFEAYNELCIENSSFNKVEYTNLIPIKKLVAKLEEPDNVVQ